MSRTATAKVAEPTARPAPDRQIFIEHVTTSEGLEKLRTVWDDLLGQCAYADVFMSHAWAVAWWRHFGSGRQLCIAVVYQGKTPVGLAPLMISRETYGGLPARVLGFLTNNHTSRSAFIVPRHNTVVFRALARHWRRRASDWDVLRLLHLPRRARQTDDLVAALRAENLLVFGPDRSNQLFHLPVQGTHRDYLTAQDRKFRRNLNHARNALAKAGTVTVDVLTGAEEIDAGVRTFFALDAHSHKQGVANAIYTRDEKDFCRSLCRELAGSAAGGYELWILKIDGRPICGLLVLLHRATSLLLVTYYDERVRDLQPGRNLFAAAVQGHYDGGAVREIDFNGNSAFVQTWTSCSDTFEALSACHRRPYSLVIAASKALKRSALAWRARRTPRRPERAEPAAETS